MAGLTIKTTNLPNGFRVALAGDASRKEVEAIEGELQRLAATAPELIAVDLSKLQYISSAGMVVFLRLRRMLASTKGTLRLGGANPLIAEAFRHANLHRVLEFVESV